jgi:hypothetical protein
MSEREDIQEAIARRITVVEWIETPLGRYLVARAQIERANALEELATINPTESAAIALVQARVRVRDDFLRWLNEALVEGEAAEARAQQLDSDD